MVSDVQFDKVQALIEKGIEEGATLVTGGAGRPENLNRGYFVKPTVFGNVIIATTIAQEIFGPVLSIISYNDVDDAVSIANDTVYGLAAYVSGRIKMKWSALLDVFGRSIHLNHSGGADAPFGDMLQLYGRCRMGIEDYLEVKAILGA